MTTTLTSDEREQWIACRDEMPPEGERVKTKIDDDKGIRNEQWMCFQRNLWWIGEGRDAMYVYYAPTHWSRS